MTIYSTKRIYRAARRMLLRFGTRAALEAANRGSELAQRGEKEGAALWQAIREQIERDVSPDDTTRKTPH